MTSSRGSSQTRDRTHVLHFLHWQASFTTSATWEAPSCSNWGLFFITVCGLVTAVVKILPEMPETQVQSLGWEDSLEKGMATHSGILA